MSGGQPIREHPILFSGAMVRALFSGAKTQTRRVVTPRNSERGSCPASWPYDLGRARRDPGFGDGEYLHVPFRRPEDDWSQGTSERWRCRLVVGERLWVRERWRQRPDDGVIVFDADGAISFDRTSLAYRLGIRNVQCSGDRDYARYGFRRRPSIHMPRWAARITLDIVNVRVQRLQDISEDDAVAEGVRNDARDGRPGCVHRELFAQLWNQINGKRTGCDWTSNPWVWAVTLRRIGAPKP